MLLGTAEMWVNKRSELNDSEWMQGKSVILCLHWSAGTESESESE